MSFANFVPDVFGVQIMEALKQATILAGSCYNVYKGKIMEAGDTITFEDVGDPTVHEVKFEDRNKDIPALEQLSDDRLTMKIRQIRVVNFGVGDIDAKIANKSINALMGDKVPRVMAQSIDKYIANLVADANNGLPNLFGKGQFTTVGKGNKNPLYLIDDITQALYENNVPESDEVVMFVTPTFYTLCKQEYGAIDTDNSGILKMGKIGKYADVTIKRTNSIVHMDGLDADAMFVKTKKAMGYAGAMRKIKAYEPEDKFEDAIKGLYYFDAKVINPQQGFLVPTKYAMA